MLLETKIVKDDGYQKQQGQTPETRVILGQSILTFVAETLIVWTETNGTDMALSFQEADGCAVIWWGTFVVLTFASSSLIGSTRDFVSHVQQQLIALGPGESRA